MSQNEISFNLFANDLGICIESFPEEKSMGTGLFANGFFRKITNSVGTFTFKVAEAPVDLGLTKECEFSYEPSKDIPKIPISIYQEIENFFKHIQSIFKSEVYCSIVWDKEKRDFFINVPEQKVSSTQVDYENEVLSNSNWIEVCQIHSHSSMDSFFSPGDDKDEVAGKLFGVIGRCNTDKPTSVWRVGFNRQTKPLLLEEIFDLSKDKLHNDSDYTINYEEAISKISERKTSSFKFNNLNSFANQSTVKEYSFEDYFDDTFYSDVFKKTLKSPYTSNTLTDTLIKNTIFDSKDGLDELKFFLFDFNTLFQKKATVKDQDIYNIYSSLSTLVFENFNCDSELYNNIIQEVTNVYEANI